MAAFFFYFLRLPQSWIHSKSFEPRFQAHIHFVSFSSHYPFIKALCESHHNHSFSTTKIISFDSCEWKKRSVFIKFVRMELMFTQFLTHINIRLTVFYFRIFMVFLFGKLFLFSSHFSHVYNVFLVLKYPFRKSLSDITRMNWGNSVLFSFWLMK